MHSFPIEGRCDFSKISENTWRDFGFRIADGLISHLVIFRPDITVLCGSIIENWSLFEKHLITRLEMHRGFSETKNIQHSTVGDLSGAIGAAMLAQFKIGKVSQPS